VGISLKRKSEGHRGVGFLLKVIWW
jgi:hypothetical protein